MQTQTLQDDFWNTVCVSQTKKDNSFFSPIDNPLGQTRVYVIQG